MRVSQTCLQVQMKRCGCFTEVQESAQARRDAYAIAEANGGGGGGGATPGAQPVTQSDLDKDGSLNVRKRRAVEEVGRTEPTVKVRRKGNGAPEGTKQMCGEINHFYQQVTNIAFCHRCQSA